MGRAFVASSSTGPRAASVVGGGCRPWCGAQPHQGRLPGRHRRRARNWRSRGRSRHQGVLVPPRTSSPYWTTTPPVRDAYNAFSETAFYSARGLEVVAPVFRDRPRLPAPLGPLVYTLDRFTGLPLGDRLTAFPLTPPSSSSISMRRPTAHTTWCPSPCSARQPRCPKRCTTPWHRSCWRCSSSRQKNCRRGRAECAQELRS